LIFFVPNYLGDADNYIQANPMKTPAHIVPEWYFLPYYAILRSIPNKLAGVIAMFGAIALLAFLPWLDTSKVRSAKYRPTFKICFWIFVATGVGLGYLGAMPAAEPYVTVARILDVLYFGFFLVALPVLGLKEKTLPVPATIADAVLAKSEAKSAPAAAE
jgi:quinol-cytochrome oxidoreductase complex cytochrome b subunit